MSSIEDLKAEAVALRESEKAAGREMKHCDALEIIAKKHGYGSWRAGLAILGRSGPAGKPPASATSAPGSQSDSEIHPSRLLEGDFAAARQTAFTHWLAPGLMQAAVDFSRNIGLLPIYSETSDQGTRYLFWNMPAGALCEVRSARPKDKFLEFNRKNNERGGRLLSLHISPNQLYSAIWISADYYPVAVQCLSRFGISPAQAPG